MSSNRDVTTILRLSIKVSGANGLTTQSTTQTGKKINLQLMKVHPLEHK